MKSNRLNLALGLAAAVSVMSLTPARRYMPVERPGPASGAGTSLRNGKRKPNTKAIKRAAQKKAARARR